MLRLLSVRLTLLYTLLLSVLALVVFFLAYGNLEKNLLQRVDDELLGEGREFVDYYHAHGLNNLIQLMELEAIGDGVDEVFFKVYSPERQVIMTSDLGAWDGLPPSSPLLDSSQKTRLETIELSGRSEYARSFYQDLGDGYLLQVGVLLTDDQQLLASFRRVCLIAFSLMVLCGGFFGWLVARRALSGIELVRHSADRISRGDLSQPIPLNRSSMEVENLTHSFNRMQSRVQTLIRELQDVSNNVAHDLRSPVTRIRGLAETTLTGPQSLEDYRELAGAVVEESDRLVGMINTMLEIAETDAGIRPPSGEQVDLVTMINDVTDIYAVVAEDKAITVAVDTPSHPVFVAGDRSRLQRVFANLLDNALKFTPRGGHVFLTAGQEKGQVVLTVVDDGPGILAEDLPRICDRFFRGEQSRTTAGSGLGLSLAKAIIQAHGGRLEVQSPSCQGTVVTIYLPVMD